MSCFLPRSETDKKWNTERFIGESNGRFMISWALIHVGNDDVPEGIFSKSIIWRKHWIKEALNWKQSKNLRGTQDNLNI